MSSIIGDTLPLAVGIAISPVPIIAAILMLLSPHATRTSPAFLVGWVAGVAVSTTVFVILSGAMDQVDPTESNPLAGTIKVLLGVALLLLAAQQWRSRPAPGETPTLPSWMQAINTMPPSKAVGIGALLSGLNPKNLMLAAAAGIIISEGSGNTATTLLGVVIFTVIASLSVGGPIIAYLVMPKRLAAPLQSLRAWLEHNNAAVMAVVLLLLGVSVIGKGLGNF